MHIVYLHQYFVSPSESGGQRSYYFAKGLVQKGHRVTMITSNVNHSDWKLIEHKDVDGINVIYVKNAYSSSMGVSARAWSFLRFMIFSTLLSFKQKKVDLIFATSTPLTIAIPAILIKFFKRIPFVFEARDLWPDVPMEMGYIENKWLFKLLKKYENLIYRYCDYIVAISYGIMKLIEHEEKTSVLPFGSNADLFKYCKKSNQEKFTVLFTGAIGVANQPEYLLEVAKLAQDNNVDDVEFVMVGNGSAKSKIMQLAKDYSLKNFFLHDAVPVADLQEYFSAADVGVILFGDQSPTYRYTASPNKFFDYLAAGLPIVYNFEGPLKQYCLDENIGFYVDCQNPVVMFELIVDLTAKRAQLEMMANKCRILAETKFNRVNIVEEFTTLIENHAV